MFSGAFDNIFKKNIACNIFYICFENLYYFDILLKKGVWLLVTAYEDCSGTGCAWRNSRDLDGKPPIHTRLGKRAESVLSR